MDAPEPDQVAPLPHMHLAARRAGHGAVRPAGNVIDPFPRKLGNLRYILGCHAAKPPVIAPGQHGAGRLDRKRQDRTPMHGNFLRLHPGTKDTQPPVAPGREQTVAHGGRRHRNGVDLKPSPRPPDQGGGQRIGLTGIKSPCRCRSLPAAASIPDLARQRRASIRAACPRARGRAVHHRSACARHGWRNVRSRP